MFVMSGFLFRFLFSNDKEHTVQDQHHRNRRIIIKMFIQPVIERQSDNDRGNAGHQDLEPHGELPSVQIPVYPLLLPVCPLKRPELSEIQKNDSEDRAELDDNEEHVPVVLRDIELQELLDQDHVAGRTDREPLRDAFNDAQYDDFNNF